MPCEAGVESENFMPCEAVVKCILSNIFLMEIDRISQKFIRNKCSISYQCVFMPLVLSYDRRVTH